MYVRMYVCVYMYACVCMYVCMCVCDVSYLLGGVRDALVTLLGELGWLECARRERQRERERERDSVYHFSMLE
jgi:hypothetical protein